MKYYKNFVLSKLIGILNWLQLIPEFIGNIGNTEVLELIGIWNWLELVKLILHKNVKLL